MQKNDVFIGENPENAFFYEFSSISILPIRSEECAAGDERVRV